MALMPVVVSPVTGATVYGGSVDTGPPAGAAIAVDALGPVVVAAPTAVVGGVLVVFLLLPLLLHAARTMMLPAARLTLFLIQATQILLGQKTPAAAPPSGHR